MKIGMNVNLVYLDIHMQMIMDVGVGNLKI
jgi:hypothetical protein